MQNKYILLLCCSVLFIINSFAQDDFINRGTIQYEMKVNNHKNFMDGDDEDNSWVKLMIENTPKFSTYYYTLKFNEENSLYTYKGKEESNRKMWNDDQLEDNIWYSDYNNGKYTIQKNIFSEIYKLEDSLNKMKWKIIPNENRDFLGFNCKKAVCVLYDSVYVFAYYSDAITVSGGPMTFNGLPGMILGITIPRLNISCIATSFTPLVNPNEIIMPKKGKIKPVIELQKKILEATKDWGNYGQKAVWQGFL